MSQKLAECQEDVRDETKDEDALADADPRHASPDHLPTPPTDFRGSRLVIRSQAPTPQRIVYPHQPPTPSEHGPVGQGRPVSTSQGNCTICEEMTEVVKTMQVRLQRKEENAVKLKEKIDQLKEQNDTLENEYQLLRKMEAEGLCQNCAQQDLEKEINAQTANDKGKAKKDRVQRDI